MSLCENNLELIEKQIGELQPNAVVIDSIQSVYLTEFQSAPGSITQVRECAAQLLIYAKKSRHTDFSRRACDKRGNISRPTRLRTYSRYCAIF